MKQALGEFSFKANRKFALLLLDFLSEARPPILGSACRKLTHDWPDTTLSHVFVKDVAILEALIRVGH